MSNTQLFTAGKERKTLTFANYFTHFYSVHKTLLVGKSQQKPHRDGVKDYLSSLTFSIEKHTFLVESGFIADNKAQIIVVEYLKQHASKIKALKK